MEEINVIGTGYIGSLISVHLSEEGNRVTALDEKEAVKEKGKWFSHYCDIEENLSG